MSEQMRPPMQRDEGVTWVEHRRALHRFRFALDEVLEWFAVVQTLPARRADDRALREAIEQARAPLAAILAVLDRMEPAASWIEPADVPADEGEQAREQAGEEREASEGGSMS